ncbi:hypothetical protein [Pseudomonas phage PPAT]|uniref:Uncharacterized protein n=1 Tax=Pseudomonas phage PPAT TaxID=2871158 RepID=A0A8K1NCK0_9VIRU|nr:hypothetical protein [Pseudomonas phage PPAT]
MMEANAPLGINKIIGRPVVIVEGFPYLKSVIDRYGEGRAKFACGTLHVLDVLLVRKLGGMNTHDNKSLVLVFPVPFAHIGQDVAAIDTTEGPEIHQHHLAAQRLNRERR